MTCRFCLYVKNLKDLALVKSKSTFDVDDDDDGVEDELIHKDEEENDDSDE